ncbi:low-specificity L-threonine aldolase, partial [Enterococcus hirae]
EDHRHAKQLAQRLQDIDKLSINQDLVQTNMLFVKTTMDTAEALAKFLNGKGITIIPAETMRWVMHLNISDADVDYIEEQVKAF